MTNQRLETESGAVARLLAAAVVLALLGLTLAAGPASAQNIVGPQPVNSIMTVGPTSTAGQASVGVRGPALHQLVSATGVAAETTTEGADIGATTAHGAERVAGAGATRGGVLSPQQILEVRGSGEVWSQADGAAVRVLQNQAGRFNVVVDGDRGLITTFSNLSQKSFDRLANNYGWTP